MSNRQEIIDAIEGRVAALGTVVGSAVALISGFVQAVRDAKDDDQELEAVLASIEEQADRLGAAVASSTVAADEEEPADPQTGGEDSGDADQGADTPQGGEGEDALGDEPQA